MSHSERPNELARRVVAGVRAGRFTRAELDAIEAAAIAQLVALAKRTEQADATALALAAELGRLTGESAMQSHRDDRLAAKIVDAIDERRRGTEQTPRDGRWMTKTEAARAAGISLERLRPWCTRRRNPLPHRFSGGRELVNLDDVLREIASKSGERTERAAAEKSHAKGTRKHTQANAVASRAGRRQPRR